MEWLQDFLADEQRRSVVLDESGAVEAARAHRAVLERLQRALRSHTDAPRTVKQAAIDANRCEETIRRKIRAGEIPAEKRGRRHAVLRTALTLATPDEMMPHAVAALQTRHRRKPRA